jgi:hypothetical protein
MVLVTESHAVRRPLHEMPPVAEEEMSTFDRTYKIRLWQALLPLLLQDDVCRKNKGTHGPV